MNRARLSQPQQDGHDRGIGVRAKLASGVTVEDLGALESQQVTRLGQLRSLMAVRTLDIRLLTAQKRGRRDWEVTQFLRTLASAVRSGPAAARRCRVPA